MRRPVALLAGALTVLLAACGGGSGQEEQLTADQFRQQADAICKQYEDRIDALGNPRSLADLGDFVERAVPIIEEGNGKLRALQPPEELADDWSRAMELQDQNLGVAKDLEQAIQDKDTPKVQELLAKLDATDAQSNRIARSMGLEECGQTTD